MNRWATICRYGGIGDNLVASSVLPGLKAKYGMVEVISQSPYHVVFENNPNVDKLSVHGKDDVPAHVFADWHRTRAKESDFFVNLSHSMETFCAFLPAQTQFQWPSSARRKFAGRSYLEIVHDVCDLPYQPIGPEFYPTEDEVDSVNSAIQKRVGERYVAWVLCGTRVDKIYPWATYAIGRIIHELKLPVVMIGGPPPAKDLDCAALIRDHVIRQNGSDRDLYFAISKSREEPDWPIRRVLTVVQRASAVIGPDTGPMWAVATKKMPKIVLLSHASPENITRYWVNTTTLHASPKIDCWPCHQLHDTLETCRRHKLSENDFGEYAACIADIGVDRLVNTLEQSMMPKVS